MTRRMIRKYKHNLERFRFVSCRASEALRLQQSVKQVEEKQERDNSCKK